MQLTYSDPTIWDQLPSSFCSLTVLTIDELFGIVCPKEAVYSLVSNVPWPDDGKIRVAVYNGRKLLDQSANNIVEGVNVIDVQFHGHPFNISGVCKVVCTKNTNY